MKQHLFLTGAPELRNAIFNTAIRPTLAISGGFLIEIEHQAGGSRAVISPACSAAGVEGFTLLPFWDTTVVPPVKDNDVIRTFAVRCLEEAGYYPFACLQNIGGIDLMIPQYRTALETLLNSELPVIGTVLSADECHSLQRSFSISDRFLTLTANLPAVLAADENAILLDLDRLDLKAAERICNQWAKEFVYS